MDDGMIVPGLERVDFIAFTAAIVSAYVSNNTVPTAELPALLSVIHATITELTGPAAAAEPATQKATPMQIRRSITPEALTSFIDGKPYKVLKRHLAGNGLTIEQYRQRFGLPPDYPSTAASHSAQRSAFAKSNGLGRLRRKAASKAAPAPEAIADKPKTRVRRKSATAAVE